MIAYFSFLLLNLILPNHYFLDFLGRSNPDSFGRSASAGADKQELQFEDLPLPRQSSNRNMGFCGSFDLFFPPIHRLPRQSFRPFLLVIGCFNCQFAVHISSSSAEVSMPLRVAWFLHQHISTLFTVNISRQYLKTTIKLDHAVETCKLGFLIWLCMGSDLDMHPMGSKRKFKCTMIQEKQQSNYLIAFSNNL
uniref:Uncharacterized protein n=1 Tax=Cucumis melo TaxID=3656 RepID=A0A9I9EC84_CUCME